MDENKITPQEKGWAGHETVTNDAFSDLFAMFEKEKNRAEYDDAIKDLYRRSDKAYNGGMKQEPIMEEFKSRYMTCDSSEAAQKAIADKLRREHPEITSEVKSFGVMFEGNPIAVFGYALTGPIDPVWFWFTGIECTEIYKDGYEKLCQKRDSGFGAVCYREVERREGIRN